MQAPIVRVFKEFPKILKRNIGISAPALSSDPIQQLFLDKLKEYKKKSQGGKLVDVTPEVEKELKSDLYRLEKQYDATGVDMTKFPKLEFAEPNFDPIDAPTASN